MMTLRQIHRISAGFAISSMFGLAPLFADSKRVLDVEYARVDGESLKLDMSIPGGGGPHPAVILIHGGGWSSGDKAADFTALLEPLEAAGFAWFSINYRLAPKHRWPACFDDVNTALQWVREHSTKNRIDPRRIALLGYSAGGHLAALAAIRADPKSPVQAVVGLAPAVELVADTKRRGQVGAAMMNLLDLPDEVNEEALAKIAAISPAEEVKPGLPPFLIVQGSADKSVRHVESLAFVARLKEAKVAVNLLEMKDAPHRISEWQKFSPDYPARTVSWLSQAMKPIPSPE